MNRRRFLKSLAAAPLAPAALVPQAPPPTPAPAPAAPSPTPAPSASPTAPGPVAEALGEVVRLRYGSPLEAADLVEIKKGIQGNLDAAERLRKRMKLGNADEPVNLFRARPGPPPAPPAPPRRRR